MLRFRRKPGAITQPKIGSSSAAAPPGSTPAPTTPSSKPPSSSPSSRTDRGLKIACLEEISFRKGWIDRATLEANITKLGKSSYGAYLRRLIPEA